MCFVIFNAGSSSLRISVFNAKSKCIFKGHADAIGQKNSQFREETSHSEKIERRKFKTHEDALVFIMKRAPIEDGIQAGAHRIVHGGTDFQKHRALQGKDIEKLRHWVHWAPLHLPAQIQVIEWMQKHFPNVKNFGIFDTAFHSTLPELEKYYGIPKKIAETHGWWRYGFHGISCEYLSQVAGKKLKKKHPNLLICHLGNGCSVTAVKQGISVGTSMGMTPLEGPIMGTRSGTVDPGLILEMAKVMGIEKTEKILTKESGFLGLSQISSDVRNLLESRHPSAKMTLAFFARQVAKTIAQMRVALGVRPDAIVFSGGIGENAKGIQKDILRQLPFETGKKLVIRTNEEQWMADFIAQQTLRKVRPKSQ